MNDYAEIIWFLDLIEKYANEKGCYRRIVQKWGLIEDIMKRIMQEIEFPYILCLSKENDVLSQWRSYADDGKGVAIGINVDVLLNYSKSLVGRDIIYETEKQMDLINQERINNCLNEIEAEIFNNDEQVLYGKVKKLVSFLLNNAMLCKNPAFKEENEYRIACLLPNNQRNNEISEIKYRTNNGCILPYREINFKRIRRNLIENITIGPKSLLNDRNLWLFLRSQEFTWTTEDEWSRQDEKWLQHVKVSTATYR